MKTFKELVAEVKETQGQLDETVYDTIRHPVHGRVEWGNMGGAHIIATRDKTGSLKIHAMGTHKEIADKWGRLKKKISDGRFNVQEGLDLKTELELL